ncbi:hypothetical protein [Promicromonospora sp. NPDC050262]|uniref:hypothetical protein n=1 Tax=Promicromonospora sp. NPDC050262 TaxID=3155036 RepID=UPI003402B2FD
MADLLLNVGDHLRVTVNYYTLPAADYQGVLTEFEPTGFDTTGRPFPPYAVVCDPDGNYLVSFPLDYDARRVSYPDVYRVELVRVYPRDAAWWDRPGTARAYHAPDDPHAPVWAACAPGRILLHTPGASTPDQAPALCRRPACTRRTSPTKRTQSEENR